MPLKKAFTPYQKALFLLSYFQPGTKNQKIYLENYLLSYDLIKN